MKPNTNYIVAGLVNRLSLPDAPDASMLYWRSFSPFWWSVVQLLIAGLDQPYIWENYNPALRQQILDLMLPEDPTSECPDCEDCEECPPEQPRPGGGAAVGRLGMTLEELEDFYMCVNIAAGLKVEDGVLYAKDDCCTWQAIGNISALAGATSTAPQTFGAAATIANGVANLVKQLPMLTPIPHPTTEFNNDWTRKCLKATALKYILQTLFVDMRDSAAEIPATGWAVFMASISAVLSVTPLKALTPVANAASWVTKWGADFLVGEIDDLLADGEMWDNFVCDFANDMTGAETFTGQDISNFYAKAVTYTALFAEWGLDLIDNLVPTEFQARVNENISAVTCECSDYLPNGYTPALPSGSFQFTPDRLFKGASATGAILHPASGSAFADIDTLAGSDGVLSGLYPQTELVADSSGAWWHEWSLLLKMSEEATITNVKLSVVYPAGEPPSGQNVGAKVNVYQDDLAQWATLDTVSGSTSPYPTEFAFAPGGADHITYISLGFFVQSPNSGAQKTARAVSIRISGTYGGGDSFSELEIGEVHTP